MRNDVAIVSCNHHAGSHEFLLAQYYVSETDEGNRTDNAAVVSRTQLQTNASSNHHEGHRQTVARHRAVAVGYG